jgi:hypothetical protein
METKKTMSGTQEARLDLALNNAEFWYKFIKDSNEMINKQIFEEENFQSRMAIESGAKAGLVNCAINRMEEIVSLLREMKAEENEK